MTSVFGDIAISLDGFVTGPGAAIERARWAAGERDVFVMGGGVGRHRLPQISVEASPLRTHLTYRVAGSADLPHQT